MHIYWFYAATLVGTHKTDMFLFIYLNKETNYYIFHVIRLLCPAVVSDLK